ncbi:hypothetical protein ACFWPU_07110 [Streptomyces sp. NPDC058471]|uniref:hypothetical protein n=1 Tax=Streptomyces sp. NPDC058471 TaxID=3346516 RepID=UPI0036562F44
MSVSTIIALISAATALGAATLAAYTARGNSTRASFDLALALYSDLTSKETARSRSILESYRRGNAPTEQAHSDVMDHYFALLWQFEKIYAGREALQRQKLLNGSAPAVQYLDDMIDWHVAEWAARWLDIHTLLQAQLPPDDTLDDRHTLQTFCKLADHFRSAAGPVRDLRQAIPGTAAPTP